MAKYGQHKYGLGVKYGFFRKLAIMGTTIVGMGKEWIGKMGGKL